MTKPGAWKFFSVMMAVALVLGVGAIAVSSPPAQAQAGTWTTETVDDADVWNTSLKLDSNDNPHISYTTTDLTSLHYANFTGADWYTTTVAPDSFWTSSLALDSNDHPHIGYSDFISLLYTYSAGGAWTTEPVLPPGPPFFVWDCSLALDSGNQPCMSFSLASPIPLFALFYTYRTGSGWQFLPPVEETIVSSSSLALDRNDQPCISYTDGELKYAEWTGEGWALQSVDPDNPGEVISTSLALDSNDRPNIAYADIAESGSLRYARWTGSSWALETVDSSSDIVDCSLALDSQDHPHICYLIYSGGLFSQNINGGNTVQATLKYAEWTGEAWEIQIVDQETAYLTTEGMTTLDQKMDIFNQKMNELGGEFTAPDGIFFGSKFSSIALDSNDLPHISYGSLIPTSGFSLHYASFVPAVVIPTPASKPSSSPSLPRQFNPPQWTLQYLNVSPQQVAANQPVTITTNVANTGDQAGNYNVALKINGQVEQSRMVSVGPKASQPVKFTVTKAAPGTYAVDIVDQKGSFTVLGDSSSGGAASSKTGAFIALALIGVLIVATVVVLLFRRA